MCAPKWRASAFPSKSKTSPEKYGATLFDVFRRGKEILDQVKHCGRPFRFETDVMLLRDVGKTAGHICTAGEDNPFDFRSDRRERRADIVAAIEKGGAGDIGDGLSRRGH